MKKEKKKGDKKVPVEFNPELPDTEDVYEAALTVQQRIKRSKVMKRYKHRLKRRRDIILKRAAGATRLVGRARRGARGVVKNRFLAKKSGAKASYGERARSEKLADRKKALTTRISKKMVKDKRRLDTDRRKNKIRESLEDPHLIKRLIENFQPEMEFYEFVQDILPEEIHWKLTSTQNIEKRNQIARNYLEN